MSESDNHSEHPAAHSIESRLQAAREAGPAAAALLREAGCRPTAQRLLVLQALGSGGHLSADQILAQARERNPSINSSTVHRALDALVAAGVARRTYLGPDRSYFEIARGHRHHHAVCERCGAVAHLHDAALQPLSATLEAETGFVLSPEGEITLPGLCRDCQGYSAAR